jgi:ribosomal protein S18 acetylase RimI-like enzyme
MTISTRLLEVADAEPLAALMARIEADHMTGFCLSAPEVVELLEQMPSATHEGAWDGDELVAYTTLMPHDPTETEQHFVLFGDVDPGRFGEGLGTLMLARGLDRAREHHARTASQVAARYVATAYEGRDDQADLLASAGLTPGRHSYRMVARLDGDPPEPSLPADLTVSAFDPADAEELRVAHNAVFADYPDGSPADPEFWNGFMIRATHARPGLSPIARDAAGAVAGYVFTHEYAVPVSGQVGREIYVPYLGTRADQRGRGLASGLLAKVLRDCRDAGYDHVSLDVDTENPTGALAIYQRAGFVQVGRRDFYQLVEPPSRA